MVLVKLACPNTLIQLNSPTTQPMEKVVAGLDMIYYFLRTLVGKKMELLKMIISIVLFVFV